LRHTLLIFVTLFAAASPVSAAIETTFREFERPTLAGPSVQVSGMELSSDRIKVTLSAGSAAPVKAGDTTVGLFFKGDGVFVYTSDDPIEFPVMRANAKNTKTGAEVTATATTMTVKSRFQQLLWLSPGKTASLGTQSGVSLDEPFAEHLATFDREVEGQRGVRMAAQKMNGSVAGVRAEFVAQVPWIYTRDDVNDQIESLESLYSWDFEDRERQRYLYRATIAESPMSGDRRKPKQAPAVITNLDYTITTADNRNVQITARETIRPFAAGHRALWFTLMDVIFDDRGVKRFLRLKNVALSDGTKLPFVHANGNVLVELPSPTASGKPFDIVFDIEGDILIRYSGDSYWILQGAWYPHFERSGLAHTVHGVVKTKAPFIPLTGGKTVARKTEGEMSVVETTIDQPVSHIAIIAGKFHFSEEAREKLTIRTASYAAKNERAIKQLTDLAFDMIAYYEFFLGPFPFQEFTIVEINDLGWGQAPAGLMFITTEAFNPLLGEANQIYSGAGGGINERFAHEIAHQYWGTNVAWPSWDEQWLSESFAEYSAGILLRKLWGPAKYKTMLMRWKADGARSSKVAPIPLANRYIVPNSPDETRYRLLYAKGPHLLATLHQEVGDDVFLTFLKSYQKTFRNKFGSTADVAGLLGFITKKDYKPFFEQQYWGTAMP
jgi:hypothetical protein